MQSPGLDLRNQRVCCFNIKKNYGDRKTNLGTDAVLRCPAIGMKFLAAELMRFAFFYRNVALVCFERLQIVVSTCSKSFCGYWFALSDL